MQTLGAVPARIVGIVVAEGAFIGALSWVGALVISTVLSMLLGTMVGAFLFDGPLGLVLAPPAVIGWLVVALSATALAGAYPASSVARMTVRETLAYVWKNHGYRIDRPRFIGDSCDADDGSELAGRHAAARDALGGVQPPLTRCRAGSRRKNL
jgi:FtsX-like permease family